MPHVGRFDPQTGNYTPPPGVLVHFRRGGTNDETRTFALNPSASWDGTIASAGYWAMFSQGRELPGWFISQIGEEGETGEGSAMALYLAEQAAGRPVALSRAEMWQFSIANSPSGKRLGVSDWRPITGRESPVQQELVGTRRNPIIVADERFPPNHRMQIGEKFYMNDLREGKGKFPNTPTPAEPPATPPPAQPSPPARQGRQIDIDFSKAEVISIPAGATSVLFAGTIDLPATIPGGIKPLIKTALGPRDGERVNAGLFKITRDNTWGLEWDPDETRPVGGGKVLSGEIIYEWTPGKVTITRPAGVPRIFTTIPAVAVAGSVIVFGVDPPKPGSDKPPEYVRLLGGRLRGVLTITGGTAQGGPVDPPIDPLPPGGDLLELAKNGLAAAEAARNTFLALVNALEERR